MATTNFEIPINEIIIGDRIRKDIGYAKDGEEHEKSIEGLAESIPDVGLLQPIGITNENKLVFGYRRLIACRDILKWEKIPVRIVPVDSILLGQIHENSFRKEYTISERVAIVDALRSYSHGGDRKSKQTLSGGFEKLTVKQACKLVGFGEDSYYRAKEVVDKGSEKLVQAVDDGRVSITTAKFMVAKADHHEQAKVLEGDKKLTELNVKSKLRQIRTEDPSSTLDERKRLLELGKEDPDLGLVYTPSEVADFLFNTLQHLKPKKVLDVASGNGALSKPWKDVADVEEFEIGYGKDFFESPEHIEADLVVCNPPFGQEEKFLNRILEVTSPDTPVVLITSYTLRIGAYKGSRRWKSMSSGLDISSIVTLPKDIFKGARHPTEVLIIRGGEHELKPHYFLGEQRAAASNGLVTVPIIEPSAVYLGDCCRLIHELDDRSIDLCLTSPPYAEQRKNDYPSVAEEDYSEFTLEWMTALKPKLTPNGSVLINIDPHVKEGIESDYVLRLQLALREAGWLQHKTQIWRKSNANPVGRPDWPKHAYELILWYSLTDTPFCTPKRIFDCKGTPIRVTDVVETGVDNEQNLPHPARYPVRFAEHLISTFSPINGTVLDPFVGSGSTLVAAKKHRRKYIGFDLVSEYVELAIKRISNQKVTLPVVCVDEEDEGHQAA